MMRLSFLLLLMAAAACCEPISLEGCYTLDKITEDTFRGFHPEHHYKYSPAIVEDGHVICNGTTPIIGYIANDATMYPAYSMMCTGVYNWYARGPSHEEEMMSSKVCCYGYANLTVTPATKACAPLDDLTKPEFYNLTKPDRYKFAKANVTNGEVICSGDTPARAYLNKGGYGPYAASIECKGVWWVAEEFTMRTALTTTKVGCYGGIIKHDCIDLDDITQTEYDNHDAKLGPGVKVTKANSLNGNVTCSDFIIFQTGDGLPMMKADAITCTKGLWVVFIGKKELDNLGPEKVACGRKP